MIFFPASFCVIDGKARGLYLHFLVFLSLSDESMRRACDGCD